MLQRLAPVARTVGAARWFSVTPAAAADAQRVCIVGTGPAGFYAAKYLLKQHAEVQVDMLDLLPTPFGLVRSGVAPDHPEVKSVQNDFEEVATSPRLNFLGNVALGKDISVEKLSSFYNAVVLAYGAASDRKLGVPGEDLDNVMSARYFVNWYNAHPDFVDVQPNLEAEDVVVVGNGNVAVDCARVLGKTAEELNETDIADHALKQLSNSHVKRVHVVGRRGHAQAAFTMKELRELTRLGDAALLVDPKELAMGMTAASVEEIGTHRAKKRMNKLLTEVADKEVDATKSRSVALRFLLSPVEFLPDPERPSQVGSVKLEVAALEGDADAQRAVGTGRYVTVPAGMVLTSIGYKSLAVDGVPFDDRNHVVRNVRGAVCEEDGTRVPGLFCTGWLKRGPSGIIGTNITCAKETTAALLEAASTDALPAIADPSGLAGVVEAVVASGKPREDLVDWEGYKRIDAVEEARGADKGKPREKMTSVEEMVAVSRA